MDHSADMYSMLMEAGSHICAQNSERSFFFSGYQFPLCYRCTGIYFFLFTGIVLQIFLKDKLSTCLTNRAFYVVAFSCMLLALDVYVIQTEIPNNITRFLTGCFVGSSISLLFWQSIRILFDKKHLN